MSANPELNQAEGGTWECNVGLPSGRQGLRYLSCHLLLHGDAMPGNCNQEQRQDLSSGVYAVLANTVTIRPNAHPTALSPVAKLPNGTIFHFYHQCVRIVILHPCQYLSLSVFLIIIHLEAVKQYLIWFCFVFPSCHASFSWFNFCIFFAEMFALILCIIS